MKPVSVAPKPNRPLTAISLLVMGLVLSTLAAIFAFRAFDADEAKRFSEAVDEIHGDLQARLDYFESSVKQLAAVYAINPRMQSSEFVNYARATSIHPDDPGVYSYGVYSRKRSFSEAGDRYRLILRETGPEAPPAPVPIGGEVSSDAARMKLFNSAVETATATLETNLHSYGSPEVGAGAMVAVAAFENNIIPGLVEERRQKAIGVAFARFRESGLFDQAMRGGGSYKSQLDVDIFDGPSSAIDQLTPLYSHSTTTREAKFVRRSTFQIQIGKREFTVRVDSAQSPIWSAATVIAVLILALGVATSLVFFRVMREREEREERLSKSERQLRLVTETLPVLISYIDPSYTYRFNNRLYEELWGKPRSEITGHTVEEVVGPDVAKLILPQFKRAMGGEKVDQDWSIRLPNGATKHFHQTLLPDINHRGEVKGIVALHTDVTQRAKAQANAEFLEEVSSILATSLDTAVVGKMLAKKLLAVCDWCVIELLDEENTIDRHLWVASTPERHEKLAQFYESYPPQHGARRLTNAARETKTTQYIERVTDEVMTPWIPDPVRRARILDIGFQSIVIVPLITQDHVLGTLALYSGDPSHIYTRDDVRYFEEIGLRSALAFENARLYAQSQNLNRAKDHFLAMLSHELRTPMNVILGWLEILSTEKVDDETYAQALETLNRNAKVQLQLINDLLDVSRIINGKLSLHAAEADLGTITALAVDSVRPALRAKNIEATLKTSGNLTAVIDSERIQQVLWNLLSNAMKFTPGGGRIDVTVEGTPLGVSISVKDSGIGIEKTFLPFVFDRFRQEEGGFTRAQGGLGLGLSIVRYIVEGHGGTIEVASEGRGTGATFTVKLPRIAQIPDELYFTESAP